MAALWCEIVVAAAPITEDKGTEFRVHVGTRLAVMLPGSGTYGRSITRRGVIRQGAPTAPRLDSASRDELSVEVEGFEIGEVLRLEAATRCSHQAGVLVG
jgi:hypothetical protein